MNTDKDRLLYYIGTALLVVAVIELTVFPYIINNFFPLLYIPLKQHTVIMGGVYLASALCYAFSDKYYKKELITILILFVYFFTFRQFFT